MKRDKNKWKPEINHTMDETKIPKSRISDLEEEIEEISQRIMTELEKVDSKNLSDTTYARKILQLSDLHYTQGILQEVERASSGAECFIEKKALIKVLLFSTWLQRLYFIIRSFLMGLISTVITFGFVLYFGTINVTLAVFLAMIVFVSALAITRLFHAQIMKVTKSIVNKLGSYRMLRDFIMNHF